MIEIVSNKQTIRILIYLFCEILLSSYKAVTGEMSTDFKLKIIKIVKLQFEFKQMSKDKESICVTVRVRPLSSKELEEDSRTCLRVDQDSNMISMSGPTSEKEAKDFYFDSVCDKISQNQVFEKVGKRSTIYCMEGYNCTIFAYGQTGAGKTFTMMGVNPQSRDYFEQRGLIPRTLEHLFECIEKQISESGVDYMIKCSFVEIYNEQIIDLLGTANSSLNIREDLKKGVYIEGVTQQIITQSEEAMEILRKGSKGRHVGSTFYNETSSRSHSVFTMQIESQKLSNGIKSTKSRHFHFIDLAGSERTKKSMGDRLKEGCSINKSLHVLSMVISSLAEVSEGKARHVNYRDSKLTFLLKDSLGGNSKTHLIANISPSLISSLETKSTLMFARKVKLIKVNKVSINEDASGNLQSLKSQIRRLRSENLLLRNGNTSLPTSINLETSQVNATASNSKMVTVLQQYVDEELEKQTKMELEITKLQNKNTHLQKGIQHFSDNQKQLRMVLAIYEDKVKKMKKAEALLYQKLEEMSAGQNIEEIKQYYLSERQILLDEIQKFKNLSSSSSIVKNLLRQLKALKESSETCKEEESLLAVLTKNNQFLQSIKSEISNLEPEMQQGKASKALVKENQILKTRSQELSQLVEKYGLELAESKDKIEETENLLNEAISNQINLEKKQEQLQQSHAEQLKTIREAHQITRSQLQKAEQEIRNNRSKESSLELIISQYQLQLTQLTSELTKVNEKKQFERLNFQQKLEALTTENIKLEESFKKRGEQIQKYKIDYHNIKTQSERINKETESILGQASTKIQELEELLARAENQKSDLRSKLQAETIQWEENMRAYGRQNEKNQKRNNELCQQIRSYQQQILKHEQQHSSLKQKLEQNNRLHHQEKLKWEQNHNQLIKVINQKKACDSETQSKLTESQLLVINLNEKLSELTIQYKNSAENLSSLQTTTSNKISDLSSQLVQKQQVLEQLRSVNEESRRKIQVFSESQHSLKRQIKVLEDQIRYRQEQHTKDLDEIEKIKKKEKETRLLLNESKNETYSLKKNYQIQMQSLKEQIRGKVDEVIHLSNQNINIKQTYQRSLAETQRKMESQFQIFKQNEGSIKSAMEAHLTNKEKKIQELKSSNDTLELQMREKNLLINNLQKELQEKIQNLKDTEHSLSQSEMKIKQKEDNYVKLQQSMNALENDHLRIVEEMQNNFNEESDSKNAQIERLRRLSQENEIRLQHLSGVEEQNNQLKSEVINRQQTCQELQNVKLVLIRDLEAIRNNGEQANNYVIELEGQLKEKQAFIYQLNENLRLTQENLHSQLLEKEKAAQKLDYALQSSQKQIENWQRNFNSLSKEKQENATHFEAVVRGKNMENEKLELTINQQKIDNQQLTGRIRKFEEELHQLVEHNNQLRHILESKEKKEDEILNFLSFSFTQEEASKGVNVITKLEEIFRNFQGRNKQLEHALEQTNIYNKNIGQENMRLVQSIRNLENVCQGQQIESDQRVKQFVQRLEEEDKRIVALTSQLRFASEQDIQLQRQVNQLRIILDQRQGQAENLQHHLASVQKKAQSDLTQLNERLSRVQEQSSCEIQRLNELYEGSKQKMDSLRNQNDRAIENQTHTRKSYELKLSQLEAQYRSKCELLDQYQNQLNSEKDKIEELHRFTDEQSYKINGLQQQRDRLSDQIQQIRLENERRLKESEKRCQLGAAQMNSLREEIKLIQDEASVWKQRMENLENEVRISNERAERFRVEYTREKQANKEFKQLLDNAQCQVEAFKSQVVEKDRLYHLLLEKVSNIQRKGLGTQDKKFNELLEKSRIEVSQIRKKYDDQLKINSLLKQELEKKDVDVSIVKERSQQYCKKQQQLIESIRSDYSKIEAELKSTQNVLNDNKKSLKKVTLKNEELEQQIQKLNKQYADLEGHNEELKRDSLKTGMDEKQMGYVNKLKQENTQLKRELQKVSEEVISLNQEKLRLKSDFRQGKELDLSSLQLSKKVSEVKYLQKIIDDSINVLGVGIIRDYKKSVGESLKFGIMELQRELAKSKAELTQLTDEISLKNQRLQILENQKFKMSSMKDEEDTLTKMRNKISKTSSTFESIRQSREDDKLILQTKDSNKASLWGLNRP